MKRRAFRSGRIAALAAWIALGASEAPAQDVACLERAAEAVQSRYEDVRDVSARFVQHTLRAGADEAVVSRGQVLLAVPGRMRWSYEEPEPSLLVSDGETLWLYDPSFGEAQKLPATGDFLGGAAARFLLGAGDMRRDFEVRALSCGESEAELELVPREPASYEKLQLSVDPASGEVRRTRVIDLLGNTASVEFEGLRTNTSPEPSAFRFDPPDDVKIIELEP